MCAGLNRFAVLQCGLRVLVMKTEPYKGCYSSKVSWQGNDLMDTGVTVFWPGLNLAGALTLTVSQRAGQTTESSKQAGRVKLQLELKRLSGFSFQCLFCSFHSKSPWPLLIKKMHHFILSNAFDYFTTTLLSPAGLSCYTYTLITTPDVYTVTSQQPSVSK